jgi:hypothetical protein
MKDFFYNKKNKEYGVVSDFVLGAENEGTLIFFEDEKRAELFDSAIEAGEYETDIIERLNLKSHQDTLWRDDDFAKIEGAGYLRFSDGNTWDVSKGTSVWMEVTRLMPDEFIYIADDKNGGQHAPEVVGSFKDIEFSAEFVEKLDCVSENCGVCVEWREKWITEGGEEIILIASNDNYQESKTWYSKEGEE